MGFRQAARVDANQPEIVKALRDYGAYVVITSQLKNAFDILAFYNGKVYPIEIKDGSKPESARRLTAGEQICKKEIERRGCEYHIIKTVEEAINLISND